MTHRRATSAPSLSPRGPNGTNARWESFVVRSQSAATGGIARRSVVSCPVVASLAAIGATAHGSKRDPLPIKPAVTAPVGAVTRDSAMQRTGATGADVRRANPRVLIANQTGREARELHAAFPDRIGHLIGPGGWREPFPFFAIDNGAFAGFDPAAFRRLLDRVARSGRAPAWVAVPDRPFDAVATLAMWHEWAPIVAAYGWPLAFVVQNGHAPDDVPSDAAVVFVGGSVEWKRATAPMWAARFPVVHVGRVTTARWVRHYGAAGVATVDGTGWFRGDRRQLDRLWYLLADDAGHHFDAAACPAPRLFAGGFL